MKGYEFSYLAYITEELDGTLKLTRTNPKTEDWEHIYRDIYKGHFYGTIDLENGIFKENKSNEWLVITNGKGDEPWLSSEHEEIKVFQKWEQVKKILDNYIDSLSEKLTFSMDDINTIFKLIEDYGHCKYVRYRDLLFLIKLSNNNEPIEIAAILKKENSVILNKVGEINNLSNI